MSENLSQKLKAAMDVREQLRTGERCSLEMDCAPGGLRPGHLLAGVLEGTGVVLDPDNCSKSFGNWEWIIPEDQTELYKQHRDTIKMRISELYNRGMIRYGSW